MTFQIELATELARDGPALFAQHADEQVHGLPLDLDLDRYLLADRIGLLRCFTVRDGETLIGYAIFQVGYSLRHRTSLQANLDSLYLHPASRGRTIGVRFMRYVETALRDEGVQLIRLHTHPGTAMDQIMGRMGYELSHHEWERRLDKGE